MDNQKLLKALKKIKEEKIPMVKLEELIEEVQQEILVEECKGTSSKQRLNSIMNLHKKMINGLRPILAYVDNKQFEGLQAFTDSHFMVALDEVDKTPIPHYEDAGYKNYPSLQLLARKQNYVYGLKFTCKVEWLLKQIKINDEIDLQKENENFNYILNSKDLKTFLLFMNFQPKDEITFQSSENDFNNIKPLLVEKENNKTFGMVLPMGRI